MYMFNLCYKHTCATDKLLLDLLAGHSQLQTYKQGARVWLYLGFLKPEFILKISFSFKRFLELRKS